MVFKSLESEIETPASDLLSWIFDRCPYDENHPILVDTKAPDNPLSWKQIKTLVCQAAAGFRASGIKKGECVFFISQSNVYYYPLIYACIATGAIYCGGSVRYSPAEAATRARAADAKHFVVEPAFLPQALEAVKSLDLDISRIIVFDTTTNEKVFKSDLGSFATWKALLEHGSEDWERFDDADTAKNTIGMRFFTSGTSGLPKAVQVSHYSLVAHINPWDHLFGETARRLTALNYLGLEGVNGHGMVTTSMKLGMTLYLVPFSIDHILEACRKFKPGIVMLDPYTATRITKSLPDGSSDLHCFRDVRCVATTLPPEVRQKLQSLLHADCLTSRPYGITEVGTVSAVAPKHGSKYDPDSVGFQWPGTLVRLADDEDKEITEYDTPGEICLQAPTMFSGYYNDPEATALCFDEKGWFRTGDVGFISADTKQWYIVGRKKEIFKVNSWAVGPAEIETHLTMHPDIADAAVAPIYPNGNQNVIAPKVKAFVVTKPGANITEEQVLGYMSGRLAPHKTITGGVEFIESVPRNALGKIMRWKLVSENGDAATKES